MNTSFIKHKELIVFFLAFFFVTTLSFLTFHYNRASYIDLNLENSETSYALKDELEEDFPKTYSSLENTSGVELSKLVPLSSDKVFISNADGFEFLVGDTKAYIFRLKDAESAKLALKGFSSDGLSYKNLVSGIESILYYSYNPVIFLKDREILILIGDEDYVVDLARNVMGNVVIPLE